MAERYTSHDTSENAQMETENLYKEFEPDANEIMFGQRTLPDRFLTARESSKRKKIIMKLVDQKLKFKLIELMGQQVASKHQQHTTDFATTIPTVSQTLDSSQPSQSYTSYHSQPNWVSYSGPPYTEGNWQQHCHSEWQSSINYPPQYGTVVDHGSWNHSFQPNIEPNVRGNMQHFHQHSKPSNESLKRKFTQNPNLIVPVVNVNKVSNVYSADNKISTKAAVDVQEEPSEKLWASSLISINCDRNCNHHPMENSQLSNVKEIVPNRNEICERIPCSSPSSFHSTDIEKLTKTPRRRRRYGRAKDRMKQIKACSKEPGTNVVFRDKFGIRCITKVNNAATDGNGLWNEVNRLATSIIRKQANQIEPLSTYEQKLHSKIRIELSMHPDTLRSDKALSQFQTNGKIEEVISEAKMIVERVKRCSPQDQSVFYERRENLIKELKALNDDTAMANETDNIQLIRTKINDVIDSWLDADVDETKRNKLISQLMTNPGTLATSELITAKTANQIDVMRQIKRILDECMIVRPGKRFFIPMHRFIDVPFVVTVHDTKHTRISEENATILRDALIAKADSVISLIKPKIINPKFSDGSLVMVCANRKTFDLVKTTISGDFTGKWTEADLSVSPVQIKNPLARNELKTVLMKFAEPQFCHFNSLMEQLKIDNSSLLVRRWELHTPPLKLIDATECLYVGVDIESLGILEQMNRVAVLLKSTVTFDICYDQSEKNYLPDQAVFAQ